MKTDQENLRDRAEAVARIAGKVGKSEPTELPCGDDGGRCEWLADGVCDRCLRQRTDSQTDRSSYEETRSRVAATLDNLSIAKRSAALAGALAAVVDWIEISEERQGQTRRKA